MTSSDTALVDLTQAKNFLHMDAASSLRVDAEYVGAGDGTTKIFTLDYTPIGGSLRLYVNGVLQTEMTHYTINGVTVTFVAAPTLNYPITASYDKTAADDTFEDFDDKLLERLIEAATKKAEDYTGRIFMQREITESHHGDSSKTLRLYKRPIVSVSSVSYKSIARSTGDGETVGFSLGYTPKSGSLTVYVDGVLKSTPEDYTLSDQVVAFTSAPSDGAELVFRFEVSLKLSQSYFEQIYIGRLIGTWLPGYEYVVRYVSGYGVDRDTTAALVPDIVLGCLICIARWYENRIDAKSQNIAGVGSVDYSAPDEVLSLWQPYKTELV